MKIAITGLANSGKTTVFNALTGLHVETTIYTTTGGEPNLGTVKVPDPRIETLVGIFKPKKISPSTVQYVDFMGLTKGDMKQNRSVFEFVKDSDALVLVVRAFEDPSIVHPLDRIDPVGDVATMETELLFGDMELVERRLEGMELQAKKGKKPNEDEKKVLLKCKEALDAERPLREVEFTEDEDKAIRHLQFMTSKPETVVLNIGEQDLNSPRAKEIEDAVKAYYAGKTKVTVLSMCGKAEMDISELPPEDAKAFLDDLGITEPALHRLINVSYATVGLISFFTVGEDEVKAWAIKKGTDALHAAGKIHSDIQRGFIRAEVVSCEDFLRLGGMAEARDKGLLRLEGKTYEVRDGDIINFRFNV